MKQQRILIAEDESRMRKLLSMLIDGWGYSSHTVSDGQEASEYMEKNKVELVISDLNMPRMSGMELLKSIREKGNQVPVILITAFGDVQTAVEAMREGAFDYIPKPWTDNDQIRMVIERALKFGDLESENLRLKNQLSRYEKSQDIIGKSPLMRRIFQTIDQVAQSKATVLITGESGTGKEIIARELHQKSDRKDKPFITLNCAAIPETLMESELFGHVKGSFTGAIGDKAGKFEQADQGTIFLDEIGELSLNVQAKLLRVLQEKELQKIGDSKVIQVDIRIIAATNKNLQEEIEKKQFREDLFYRLNVVNIKLPTLRERKEDIAALISCFSQKYSLENNRPPIIFEEGTMQKFMEYSWPGNVRELENFIEQLSVLSIDGKIPRFLLDEKFGEDRQIRGFSEEIILNEEFELQTYIENIEKQLLRKALEESSGIQTRAAELLGITRKILRYKMDKYFPDEDF